MPKTVITVIVPPMVVSSFNDALSIASMNELKHLRIIMQGEVPPESSSLVVRGPTRASLSRAHV